MSRWQATAPVGALLVGIFVLAFTALPAANRQTKDAVSTRPFQLTLLLPPPDGSGVVTGSFHVPSDRRLRVAYISNEWRQSLITHVVVETSVDGIISRHIIPQATEMSGSAGGPARASGASVEFFADPGTTVNVTGVFRGVLTNPLPEWPDFQFSIAGELVTP